MYTFSTYDLVTGHGLDERDSALVDGAINLVLEELCRRLGVCSRSICVPYGTEFLDRRVGSEIDRIFDASRVISAAGR